MAAMGVGRIRTVTLTSNSDNSETVQFGGRKMVRPVGRRLFMQAAGLVAASSVVACEDESDNYILAAVAVAVADLAGVYLIGVPVGTLAAGAVAAVDTAESGTSKPERVNVTYEAPSSHGTGTVTQHKYENMPRTSDQKGKASMDNNGAGWVQVQNTTDDDIEYVKLIADDNTEVLATKEGKSGFLDGTWEPGDDLYLTGVPETKNYTRLFFQTKRGTQGYMNLV